MPHFLTVHLTQLTNSKIRGNMFSLGVPELLVILVIVLLIFGAKRLPEIGKAFGKSVRELKNATGGDKDEISTWIKEDKEKSPPGSESSEEKKDFIQEKVEDIPGVKEAKDIKETASKIKAASKFFLKK
jgi:sec-independent protein translocase protein TatA